MLLLHYSIGYWTIRLRAIGLRTIGLISFSELSTGLETIEQGRNRPSVYCSNLECTQNHMCFSSNHLFVTELLQFDKTCLFHKAALPCTGLAHVATSQPFHYCCPMASKSRMRMRMASHHCTRLWRMTGMCSWRLLSRRPRLRRKYSG